MSVKPGGGWFSVREQVYRDPGSGLTLQFDRLGTDHMRLRVFSDAIPDGNHEITFDAEGECCASGTHFERVPRPGWISSDGGP